MKFCDYCEKDVENPCKTLEESDVCKNEKPLQPVPVVGLEDIIIESVTRDTPIEIEYREPKGKRGYVDNPKVDHPHYYNRGSMEVKDFCREQSLCPNLKEAVCYIVRAYWKDPATWKEDLEKAIWYIQDTIDEVDKTGYFPIVEGKKIPRAED